MKNETLAQFDRMTKTPVERLVITLSVPTIISMLVSNIYNLVDTAFVGSLGNSASGAVGVVFGFMAILQAIGFMFGQGSGSLVSRSLGAQNIGKATEIASTGFFSSLFIAIAATIICFVFIEPIIYVLGSTPTIAPFAKEYIFFILITAPLQVASFTLNVILRYEGKAFLSMIGLLAGAILNIGGDAILMFGFKMGIAGAGLSTAISQSISFLILLSAFLRGKTQVRISIKQFSPNFKLITEIIGTGFPTMIRQGLNSLSTILLNHQAGIFGGDTAIAAMSIVSRIFFFIFSISLGVGQGFQPVSAFNYGARKFARIRQAFRFTTCTAEILVFFFSIFTFIFAQYFVRLFRDDVQVIEIAARALRLQCAGILFLPFSMTCEMLFQVTGKKLQAAILSSCRSGLFFIPILLILSFLRGISGIQEAQPLAYIISIIPSVILVSQFFNKLPKTDEI